MGSEGEYYRRSEHDEIPVGDSRTGNISYAEPKDKNSLTNSYLDKLEKRIFQTVSQELQTDDSSLSSLESNIRIFKTTVEKIFVNFYTSMRDFEHYKRRFQVIITKSKEGSVDDMEDFIKDMFEHIMSSENSASKLTGGSSHSTDTATREIREETVSSSKGTCTDLSTDLLEAYKNDNYVTDSTLDENMANGKSSKINNFIIFALGEPCLKRQMNDRNLLSEVNIREPRELIISGCTASADNFKRLAAKKLEVEEYVKQRDHDIPDRDIPVKVSNPKKNIYLNEDFVRNNDRSENSTSLISKICNILCKKFRKSSFG